MSTTQMQKIPLVDLKAQYHSIRAEIDETIASVLEKTAFIMGPAVETFEQEFAAFSNAKRCVAVSSGTTALHLALHGLGVKPGDEVILPSHTFIATAEAICHCGARPVFVDIDETTYTIDPAAFEAAITPKTSAVIPVHIYGFCADLAPIMEIANRHNLVVVEDTAQAHGASSPTGTAGAVGHAGAFSFYPGKNLGAYGDGGGITTNDDALADKMRMLANHGRTKKYEHDYVGFNYRMDALQAAILSVKLRHLQAWSDARLAIARRYSERLADLPLTLPQTPDGHVFHLYVVRTERRDDLLTHLKDHGIGAGIHYPIPCHQQPCFLDCLEPPSLPVTERIAGEILSLPIYPELTTDLQDRVVEVVRAFFSKSS